MQLWRVKTTKMADDAEYEGTFACRSIDMIVTSLDDALTEANGRLQAENNLEVSISKQEMTERYKEMYLSSKFLGTQLQSDPVAGKVKVVSGGKVVGEQG